MLEQLRSAQFLPKVEIAALFSKVYPMEKSEGISNYGKNRPDLNCFLLQNVQLSTSKSPLK